jgi:hypothetical protein
MRVDFVSAQPQHPPPERTPIMKKIAALSLLALAIAGSSFAAEGPVPQGIPALDHVYLIMMENHSYSQLLHNPNAPFINAWAQSAHLATNYFAIAHPSLTNYLETVGGSNFGVLDDNDPDWHNSTCHANLATGTASTETTATNICPIGGTGTDAATPAIDYTNEIQGAPGVINIDGIQSIPAATNTVGKTIADQLEARGMRWKTYQESLPAKGPDGINYSDGFYDNTTNFAAITPALNPPLTSAGIVKQYAAKHNPFVYFRSMQDAGHYAKMADFGGANGLYADLGGRATAAAFNFIAPNQCNDQHGRGNAGPFCNYDPTDNGTQAGLNPALIYRGDVTVQQLVTAIKQSPAWQFGHNAIIVVWDENDYSTSPNTNQVMLVVDTNYGTGGHVSAQRYNHFSLLKTLEAGFGLPCLNHACDSNVSVMADLFSAQ